MQSSACAPASSAERATSTAVCVLWLPAPAVNGTRPPAGAPQPRALDDAMMFAGRQQRRLAGRSAGHEGGRAVIDLALAQSFERGKIHGAVAERRRQRRAPPVKLQDLGAHDTPRAA